MNPHTATWAAVEKLLRDARTCLPVKVNEVKSAVGLLSGTLEEFEEFLAHNELELAWDALAEVARRESAPLGCWDKLAQAAAAMQLSEKEGLARRHTTGMITSDQALAIARADGEKAYHDLSPFRVDVSLEPDGWHIDYELKDLMLAGGGPHYVIDAATGAIVAKRYEQ